MIVSETFPKIFERATPVLEGDAAIWQAATILGTQQASVVLVASESLTRKKNYSKQYKIVSSYAIISKLMSEQNNLINFFRKPCKIIAKKFGAVNSHDPVQFAIDAFHRSQFGFVLVLDKNNPSGMPCIIELRDFVHLYSDATSFMHSKLKIGEVASSPILSVRSDSNLGNLLEIMLRNRVRRVLISDKNSLITDRQVISYFASSKKMKEMETSPTSLLQSSVSELPSITPPFVESELSISEAVGMLSPETGDCLICERGIVTFWDLVMKERVVDGRRSFPTESADDSFSPETVEIPRSSFFQQRSGGQGRTTEIKDLTLSRRHTLDEIVSKAQKQGFISAADVPAFARARLTDPLYFEPPAEHIRLSGVSAPGRKGAIKFSSVDLFGLQKLDESYYVVDWERFRKFICQKLEVMFLFKNPSPSKDLRKAFTRFLHNYGMHWSGCFHLVKSVSNTQKEL